MALIRKIEDSKSGDTVYPQTRVKAIYDGDNNRLDNILADITSGLYRPNILINGDFHINQRGQTSYLSSSSGIYTVDRWVVAQGNARVLTNGIAIQKVNAELTNCGFAQRIERDYTGKMVTCSMKYDGNIYSFSGIFTLNYLGIVLPDGNVFRYYVYHGMTACEVILYDTLEHVIEWIKVEEGNHATPFIPRLPGEELALCQRYYEVINKMTIHTGTSMIYYKVMKRITPTIVKVSDNTGLVTADYIYKDHFRAVFSGSQTDAAWTVDAEM